MPTKTTLKRAAADKKAGKAPSTQAGEFVREGIKKFERGSPRIANRKQAIAIGLAEARREGVKLPPPPKNAASAKNGATKKASAKKAPAKKKS